MTPLQQALSLSLRMLELARDGLWIELPELEQQRAGQLRLGCAVSPVDSRVARERVEQLLQIQELDQEVRQLAETSREGVQAELRGLHRGRGATHAYTHATG